jgi:DNA uptake protein ComE-like DNA-binding protein
MQHQSLQKFLVAALWLVCGVALAADTAKSTASQAATGEPKAATTTKPAAAAPSKSATAPAKAGQPAKKPRPVDINSASAAQLMKVPGIGEAEAEKIIKNRPYSTRSSLVTRNVLSYDAYMQVKDQLAAENPPQPKPKK